MSGSPRFHGARHCGERHRLAGQPCCDALLLHRGGGFVICDGAGGSAAVAASAHAGARAAWWALSAVRRQLRRQPHTPVALLQRRFAAAFRHRRRAPWRDHTVLACCWDRQHLLLAQVGDSSLLLRRHGHWQLPLQPHKGDSPNETTFMRCGTPAAAIGLLWLPAQEVEALIAFSDGLEAAFLAPHPGRPEQLEANAPLADLVLREHRQRRGGRSYPAWLAASLADPALQALSDDDRTLVIAAY